MRWTHSRSPGPVSRPRIQKLNRNPPRFHPARPSAPITGPWRRQKLTASSRSYLQLVRVLQTASTRYRRAQRSRANPKRTHSCTLLVLKYKWSGVMCRLSRRKNTGREQKETGIPTKTITYGAPFKISSMSLEYANMVAFSLLLLPLKASHDSKHFPASCFCCSSWKSFRNSRRACP